MKREDDRPPHVQEPTDGFGIQKMLHPMHIHHVVAAQPGEVAKVVAARLRGEERVR